jgi:hypothetical protein
VAFTVLPSVGYSATLPVPVHVAFWAFQHLDQLLHREIYAEAGWVEGEPWKVGSRLHYVLLQPVCVTVSAVGTSSSPPRSVDLLNHGLGVTAKQHVSFGPGLKGGKRIRMTMTLVGKSTEFTENKLLEAATFVTHDALDRVVSSWSRGASSAPT